MVDFDAARIKDFISRVEKEKSQANTEPTFVPYLSIVAEFGGGVDTALDTLCSIGEIVRHETLNGFSFSIKK